MWTMVASKALGCSGSDLRIDRRSPGIGQFKERITKQATGQLLVPLGIILPILCNRCLRISLVRRGSRSIVQVRA